MSARPPHLRPLLRRLLSATFALLLLMPLASQAQTPDAQEIQRRDAISEAPFDGGVADTARSEGTEGSEISRLTGRQLTAIGAPSSALPRATEAPTKATVSLQYDDGEADNGYGAGDTATRYEVVHFFDLPRTPLQWDEATLCFSRLGLDASLDFDIMVYNNDGVAGAPGTLLQTVAATVNGVSADLTGTYYNFDLSSQGIDFTDPSIYIGAGWNPSVEQDFFLCSDWSGNGIQPGYSRVGGAGVWGSPPAGDDNYRALMVRGVFSDPVVAGPCVADDETLCLNGGRFQVTADWRRPDGSSGTGTGVQLTDDTGYFWFFRDTNVEMVIKVLDACTAPVPRYWVFAGGLTNVEVDIRVVDTENPDQEANYRNPLRMPFQPIQDTNAFLTCP